MTILPTVFDVGARYGPHPSWSRLFDKGLCKIHAFEPETEEFEWLEHRYRDNDRYTINNVGLGDSDTIRSLNIQCHKGQSSFMLPNLDSNWFKVVRPNDCITTGRQESVQIIRAEEYIQSGLRQGLIETPPHFLKTDTEGYDLKVMMGFGEFLSSLFAIRTEVLFSSTYQGGDGFADIHRFMIDNGFRLANLDYDGCGNAQSFLADPRSSHGIINSCEALYIQEDNFYDNLTLEQLLIFLSFLFCNSLADYAANILERRADEIAIMASSRNDLLLFIEYEFLVYSKRFENFSEWHYSRCRNLYRSIFGQEFPVMHEFYRHLNTLGDSPCK